MGIFTVLVAGLWLLRLLLMPAALQQSLPPGLKFVLDLFTLLLAVPAVYYAWKLFGLVRGRFLWKIRSRLIVAHLLIAAIPFALVIVILYVSGLLFYYQLSYYLIEKQIGIHTAQIQAYNLSLNASLQHAVSSSSAEPGVLRQVLELDARYLLDLYPTASIILRTRNPVSGKYLSYGVGGIARDIADYQLPAWLSFNGFSGLVYEDLQPRIYASGNDAKPASQLFLRSLVLGNFRPEIPYSLEVSVPFDGEMLAGLRSALGQDLLLAANQPSTGLNVMLQDTSILRENILFATYDLGSDQETVGRPVWSMPLYPYYWSTGAEASRPVDTMLFVELSTGKLVQNVLGSDSNVSRTILGALELVVGFFLIVELLSLVAGILLTKSITAAVYNLDRGTEFIRRGDFSQRIVVRSNDQLGALAQSFNQMTEYIQTLVKERVQKERLERELEIAKEVQEQLFPKRAPQMRGLELTGLCLPARIVSGDYYDFLQFNQESVGMALGDICGKGISAALLMANLQATLRSNVTSWNGDPSRLKPECDGRVAGVVKVLNHQIYSFTSANKYASFFYAVYDESCATFTYCNAGHNPPLFFTDSGIKRLTTGGTVVGIFPDAEFEQETLRLRSGDVFIAYTDGITEAVNEYGEEFGEQRLIDLVRGKCDLPAEELQKAIFDEVLGWAYEEERDDDMTLIVARFH
jgi:phosphoserine phosphatase RsbU/P